MILQHPFFLLQEHCLLGAGFDEALFTQSVTQGLKPTSMGLLKDSVHAGQAGSDSMPIYALRFAGFLFLIGGIIAVGGDSLKTGASSGESISVELKGGNAAGDHRGEERTRLVSNSNSASSSSPSSEII